MLDGDEDFRRLVAFVAGGGRGLVSVPQAPIAARESPSVVARRVRRARRGAIAAGLVGAWLVLTTSLSLAMPGPRSEEPAARGDEACADAGALRLAHGAGADRASSH